MIRYITNSTSEDILINERLFVPGKSRRVHRVWVRNNLGPLSASKLVVSTEPPVQASTPPEEKAVAPKAVAPNAVAPKAVAPKAVAPKAVAPKAVAHKAVAPEPPAPSPVVEEPPEEVIEETSPEENPEDEWTFEELMALRKSELQSVAEELALPFEKTDTKKSLANQILDA